MSCASSPRADIRIVSQPSQLSLCLSSWDRSGCRNVATPCRSNSVAATRPSTIEILKFIAEPPRGTAPQVVDVAPGLGHLINSGLCVLWEPQTNLHAHSISHERYNVTSRQFRASNSTICTLDHGRTYTDITRLWHNW